jgi:microcompartment protein CcmL/EutN
VVGQTEIIGRESIPKVCNENVEEAITEKERTTERVITQRNRTKEESKSNKNKQQWDEEAEAAAEWGTILVQQKMLCYLRMHLQYLH